MYEPSVLLKICSSPMFFCEYLFYAREKTSALLDWNLRISSGSKGRFSLWREASSDIKEWSSQSDGPLQLAPLLAKWTARCEPCPLHSTKLFCCLDGLCGYWNRGHFSTPSRVRCCDSWPLSCHLSHSYFGWSENQGRGHAQEMGVKW